MKNSKNQSTSSAELEGAVAANMTNENEFIYYNKGDLLENHITEQGQQSLERHFALFDLKNAVPNISDKKLRHHMIGSNLSHQCLVLKEEYNYRHWGVMCFMSPAGSVHPTKQESWLLFAVS